MKPSSFTQRSSSGSARSIGSPATCGRLATPKNLPGYICVCRWMMLWHSSANQCTSFAGFSLCMSWNGRGEISCTSVP